MRPDERRKLIIERLGFRRHDTIQHLAEAFGVSWLTIREAAAYSNIGINKIDRLLRVPGCPFVLSVGTKKLVKREEFERFIGGSLVL